MSKYIIDCIYVEKKVQIYGCYELIVNLMGEKKSCKLFTQVSEFRSFANDYLKSIGNFLGNKKKIFKNVKVIRFSVLLARFVLPP